ncbi:MAG: precorrin-6y C5,15-methyltransferase (decarboxylating) subunit CbiE [bacterium]|nr:precorrin-6y C5,15-methyltransferase (decarboxylating) subunit CbiE [bacterium]
MNKPTELIASKAPSINPCRIIGVHDDGVAGLTEPMLDHIGSADLVIGGTRTLNLFEQVFARDCQTFDLTGHLMQVPEQISNAQSAGKRVVVLATGDPLCHGIAGFLQSRLCIEAFEILPNLSMVQLACARLGIPWHELKICSVHSKDMGEWDHTKGVEHGLYPVLHAVQNHDRMAIFTSPQNSPDRLARMLIAQGLQGDFQMAIVEHLQRDSERLINDLTIKEAADHTFADPNIVLLWRVNLKPKHVLFGLPDKRFHQRKPDKGLITKREVRAVSLAYMQLHKESIVWDIGAGSGSVGLEAARLVPDGYIYAIEKNNADAVIAEQNRRDLGVHNYHLLQSKAPDGLDKWPDPDAVFIGGSGGNLGDLIRLIMKRLKPDGTLVMNFVTIENLATATNTLKELDVNWDVTQMQVSRSKPILHMHRFTAQNLVWIISARKT